MAPSKVRGIEGTREEAVQDLILYIWRRKLKEERAELEKHAGTELTTEMQQRLRQITFDLKTLEKWEAGSTVIEIELSD